MVQVCVCELILVMHLCLYFYPVFFIFPRNFEILVNTRDDVCGHFTLTRLPASLPTLTGVAAANKALDY